MLIRRGNPNRRKSISLDWILQTVAFEKAHFRCPKVQKTMILIENQQKPTVLSSRSPSGGTRRALGRSRDPVRTPPRAPPRPRRARSGPPEAPDGPRDPSRDPGPGLGPGPGPLPGPRPGPGPGPGPSRGPSGALRGPSRAPGPQKGPILGVPRGNSAILENPRCPYRPLISYKIGGMPTKTLGT